MVSNQSPLSDALLKAAMAEREGHSFYMMAANTTQDPKGKAAFEQLAHEELEHLGFLKSHYDSLLQTGKLNPTARLGHSVAFAGDSPIFTASIKQRIRDAHFEMSALAIGIQLERDAIKFYQEQAQTAIEPEARKFFGELAEWEAGHYNALLRQQEELKGEYWSGAGFSPF